MPEYAPQQTIEIFHLLFLKQLESKMNKSLYALKGGCNLRFFFKSIRYSEDMDLDVRTIAVETLKNKMNKILTQGGFLATLRTRKIRLLGSNASKQTETTQRWKIHLQVEDRKMAIPTKIEFSRRKMTGKTEIAPVDKDLISQYQLYPIFCKHYTREAAVSQKVEALLNRTEIQVRDIFDLSLLLSGGDQSTPVKDKRAVEEIILNVPFDAFKSQVVNYLLPEYQTYFDSPDKWNEIQRNILSKIT